MELSSNPFARLGVGLDSDREEIDQRIEELEEEEPTEGWRGLAQALRKPAERLEAEIAWLPGLDNEQGERVLLAAREGREIVLDRPAPLAETNLRIERLRSTRKGRTDCAEQLMQIALCWERVDPVAVAQQINQHRTNAGIRAKATEEKVREKLDAHDKWICDTVVAELDRMPTRKMVETLRFVGEATTRDGTRRAPKAVRRWIERYEKECGHFFRSQKAAIARLSERVLRSVNQGEGEKGQEKVEAFCAAVEQWDKVAQPIQLVRQGEGVTDDETEEVFEMTRDLSLALNNEHGMPELAARVVEMQRKVFAEAEKLERRIEDDQQALQDILAKRGEYASEDGGPAYEGEVGKLRKVQIRIDGRWIRFGAKQIETAAVGAVRWGGLETTVYGIASTQYDIWIEGGGTKLHLTMKNAEQFNEITQALAQTVGWKVMVEIMAKIAGGGKHVVTTGAGPDLTLTDEAAMLKEEGWFGRVQWHRIPWRETVCVPFAGGMEVRDRTRPKVAGRMLWRETPNAVLLRIALGLREKKQMARLSESLG